MKKLLNKWETLTNEIVELWIIDFFELDEEDIEDGVDYDWVGNSVGGVLCFADYFFNMEDIKLCIEKDIDKDKFFEWYYWNLENHPQYINLQSFVWGVAEVKQKEEE